MADNQKKDFDFFTDEMESSIETLFKPKKIIEIDPITNQIKEIEETVVAQSEATTAEMKKEPDSAAATDEKSIPSKDLGAFLEELKQAVLTLEWEISDKNIIAVKKYVDELDSKAKLENIVAKSIYNLIQDNIELMLANPLKMPAKGPIAIQKGLDILALYIERGDDAILQAGDSISSTLSLLEDIKSSFTKVYKPTSEPVFEPAKKEAPSAPSVMPSKTEEPVKEEVKLDFEIETLEDTHEASSEKQPIILGDSEKTESSPLAKDQGFESFDMDLEQSLLSSFPDKKEPIVENKTKFTTEESSPAIELEPISEKIALKTAEAEETIKDTIIERPEKKTSEEPRLFLEEVEEKAAETSSAKESPKSEAKPILTMEENRPPVQEAKKAAPEKPAFDYNSVFVTQIGHLENYIDKLKNLESVCCGIPSLSKLCLFAQSLKNEIENNKNWLSKYIDNSKASSIKPEFSFGQTINLDSLKETFADKNLKTAPKAQASSEEASKAQKPPVVSEAFSYPEIYVTVWGRETVGFIPDEIAFDGNLPIWHRKKAIRMTDIPLKYLKQWPWSKLSPMLRGGIASLPEEKLSSMSLPLKKSSNHPLGISQNPNVLILYKDNIGCVLFTDNKLQIKNVRDYKWIPHEEGDFIGYIQKDDEKIKIISLKRGS